MAHTDNVVSLATYRRRKQEERVLDQIGLSLANTTEAEFFMNPAELDQFIFSNEIFDTTQGDRDLFPKHPWDGL